MNRTAFMNQLERLLADIPASEREEALQYYNDYFEDAGEENEESVIQSLGSPREIAENMKAELRGEVIPTTAKAGDHAVMKYGQILPASETNDGALNAGQRVVENTGGNGYVGGSWGAAGAPGGAGYTGGSWGAAGVPGGAGGAGGSWGAAGVPGGAGGAGGSWGAAGAPGGAGGAGGSWGAAGAPGGAGYTGIGAHAGNAGYAEANAYAENSGYAGTSSYGDTGGRASTGIIPLWVRGNRMPLWLWIVLIIGFCSIVPGILSVITGIFGALFGLLAAWFSLILAAGALTIGLFVAGIALAVFSVMCLPVDWIAFIVLLGSGMLCVSFGFLFLMLTVLMCGKATPVIFKGIGFVCRKCWQGIRKLFGR